jgi:gluconokinase
MPIEPQAIIVMGVAGSGKTTVALALSKRYAYEFLDADDFHTADAKAQMAAGLPLTDEQRKPWLALMRRELRRHAQEGRSSVLAFSGLRAAHRKYFRESGVPVRFLFLHASTEVIAKRMAGRRGHFMPLDLLTSQIDALQHPYAEPDVINIDVDGPRGQVLSKVIAALEPA